MLEDKIDIDATPEVLKSELIGRLIEQRVQVKRQLADLSASLLPSHPRIKQLNSELDDVRSQIRQETTKIVQGLENKSLIAAARETSLRTSLNEVQGQASGQSDAEIKLRALEREAKANRDLLESYLARYRDASARTDMGAVPANATIVSRAHLATKPSFPKRGPLSALAAGVTALLTLAFVFSRALIGAGAEAPPSLASRKLPSKRHEKQDQVVVEMEEKQATLAAAYRPSAPKRAVSEPHRDDKPVTTVAPTRQDEVAETALQKARMHAAQEQDGGEPNQAPFAASVAAAKNLVQRMRRTPAAPQSHAEAERPAPQENPPSQPDSSAPNDLRSYLRRRAALHARDAVRPPRREREVGPRRNTGRTGPVLKSLSAVLNHIRASGSNNGAHAVLVVPVSADADATEEAIRLGRGLASHKRSTVLVDLTGGPSSVSAMIGVPRAPGFTDLCAGRAGFGDVLHVDDETPLQIIPAGSPVVGPHGYETGRVTSIFEALALAYDCVLLQADPETAAWLKPALEGRFQMIVAVQAAEASGRSEARRLDVLSEFGCQVMPFEQADGTQRPARPRLLGRRRGGLSEAVMPTSTCGGETE